MISRLVPTYERVEAGGRRFESCRARFLATFRAFCKRLLPMAHPAAHLTAEESVLDIPFQTYRRCDRGRRLVPIIPPAHHYGRGYLPAADWTSILVVFTPP